MEAGCSLQTCNKDEETPLHVAAVRGYFSIVQFLCERGANLDAVDKVCACVRACVCVLCG